MAERPPRIWLCADHGLAFFYFMNSDLAACLLEAGAEVLVFTEDNTAAAVESRYARPGLSFTGLRLRQVQEYTRQVQPTLQWWLDFLRRAGAAGNANLAVVDSYIRQVKSEAGPRRKRLFPLMESIARLMRQLKPARRMLQQVQTRFTPHIYADLFEQRPPDLVVAASPGFRQDRYLLREAAARGVRTAAAIISWDSSSSYGLPGAPVEWITCWSEIQKQELAGGADWPPERIHVAGMPPYDGYVRGAWNTSRSAYFARHGLDPARKLISYASSFVSWSPNYQNVAALADLVANDRLVQPAQLLIRLHPIHMGGHYTAEADRIRLLAGSHGGSPHIHIVEPAALGELGHYSGEDMPEKTGMMAHSDIFTTVYSTMCVEASFQQTPIVSICIDAPGGFPGKFWVPMSQIGVWPTHARFRTSGAGKVVYDSEALRQALDAYLQNPAADRAAQRRFLEQECTYLDGSASRRTAEFFLRLAGEQHS
jgi:hypothetical protein